MRFVISIPLFWLFSYMGLMMFASYVDAWHEGSATFIERAARWFSIVGTVIVAFLIWVFSTSN